MDRSLCETLGRLHENRNVLLHFVAYLSFLGFSISKFWGKFPFWENCRKTAIENFWGNDTKPRKLKGLSQNNKYLLLLPYLGGCLCELFYM